MAGRQTNKDGYKGDVPLADAKQELFCEIFSTNTLPAFWSNGQNSYSFAYNHYKRIDELNVLKIGPAKERTGKFKTVAACEAEVKRIMNVCSASATRLLRSVHIKARCNYLLDNLAAHIIVDRELLWTIQQRKYPDAKVAAIKHHDHRESRIRERIELKQTYEPVNTIYME